MNEIWIKKTAWFRYLVNDEDLDNAKAALSGNTKEAVDLMVDCFDLNDSEEFDNAETILPVEYIITKP